MSNYKQYDTRWAKVPYPVRPYCIKDCGCGEVSICNCITKMDEYKDETPKTIQPYCKQYADPSGNGTIWSAIPIMMKHYGMTEVQEHTDMESLWKELEKGGRVAIYLMDNTPAGSKKIQWTTQKHFICSTAYKYEDKKHKVYVKDSNSASSDRNGWVSYEDNLRNAVFKVWSGKLKKNKKTTQTQTSTKYKPTTPYAGKLPKGSAKKGDKSEDVEAVRDFLNWYYGRHIKHGGRAGSTTDKYIRKFQKEQGLTVDGIFGPKTTAKAKAVVKKYAPKETYADKIMDACKAQAEWMRNYIYRWLGKAKQTIADSKYYGTCVTYVACVLQRLGLLKPGECIWHDGKGKVSGTNDKMTVMYPKNKTLKALKNELQKGDIVIAGDPKSTEAGGNSHIFILTGKWTSGGNPYIWDNRSADRVKKGKSGAHIYNGSKHVIAVIRIKKAVE